MTEAIRVRERPILFSDEMVRAILGGRKTQTRRVIARRIRDHQTGGMARLHPADDAWTLPQIVQQGYKCPGEVGERLWVREVFGTPQFEQGGDGLVYRADMTVAQIGGDYTLYPVAWAWPVDPSRGHFAPQWKPSIHMPRWASRIMLEVTGLRIERVQNISEDDAIAEGIQLSERTGRYSPGICDYARWSYEILWNDLNASRGFGWDMNPWVWVIEFKRDAGYQPSSSQCEDK